MKKILSFFMLIIIMLTSVLIAGCSKDDENGAKVLGVMPKYVGETVTDTNHTFKNEDFSVLVTYSDYNDKTVTDFTFEVIELKDGYYTILIKWNDMEAECYVPLEMNIYASDASDAE